MSIRIILFSLLSITHFTIDAQILSQESFETETGWTLSNTFDDGDDDYCKRDSATSTAFVGLQFPIVGADGQFVVGAEDTDAALAGAPSDGIITLTLDAMDISGSTDLELVVSLACNADDQRYDDRSLDNGDYLDFQASIDGGEWLTIGTFNSAAGGTSISTLYQDNDMDGDGGEVGELPVTSTMTDFVMSIPGSGNSVQIRAEFKMDGGDEEILMDDYRLRVSPGDDVPPQVYSVEIIDQSTLEVTFSEGLDMTNAQQTFQYSGISDISSATLNPDNVVTLQYGSPFTLGQEQDLVIFGVADEAGNAMSGPYSFTFFYNPTTPDLVISEIMYNDPSDVDTLEFIEIVNVGTTEAVIGGFRLEDAISLDIPSGTTIAPGGFYLAARNAVSATAFYGLAFDDYGGMFSDNDERVLLVNAEGAFIDSVSYNDNVPWPTAADGEGPSMELFDLAADNGIGSNWVASLNGIGFVNGVAVMATPGFLDTGILPVVQFDNSAIEVNEADGTISVDIYISAANGEQSTISITYLGGTATLGEDHDLGDIPSITLPANTDGVEELTFPLYEDAIDEGAEIFTIGLSATSNAVTGANTTIDIIITDNDHTPPTLFINELLSDNETDFIDEAGEYEDWIEIYNPNFFEVEIGGYYLSDDEENITKSRLPVGTELTSIPSGGWLLLIADEDQSQGSLRPHLAFKLSSSGEEVLLTSQDGETIIDSKSFGPLPVDVSFGRNGDGADEWVEFESTTPDMSNLPLSVTDLYYSIGLYPNPSTGVIRLQEPKDVMLYDLSGRLLLEQDKVSRLDLSGRPPAIYILRSADGGVARIVKR